MKWKEFNKEQKFDGFLAISYIVIAAVGIVSWFSTSTLEFALVGFFGTTLSAIYVNDIAVLENTKKLDKILEKLQ